MSTVSAHVALTLAQHVAAVFGVMGNGNAWFLDALERHSRARFTAVRHEQGAVVAADAHYRASGRIAAATATYGAGFTNTLTALAEAVQAQVPLVLVVGDEPTSGPRPWDVDQIALSSGVGARTYTVGRSDAAATTIIALEHALTYRVPVVLAIPYDVATLEAGEAPELAGPELPAPLQPRGEFSLRLVDELADALRGAERTGALTTSSALGRGIFPDQAHDLGWPAASVPRARWSWCARPTSPSPSGPGSTSSRCASASSSRPAPGSSRWTSRPRPPTPTSAASCVATPGWWPSCWCNGFGQARRRSLAGGRASTWRRRAARSPETRWLPTAAWTHARRHDGSRSCCPSSASWSPTVVTSSAGRTCTGRSRSPTGW